MIYRNGLPQLDDALTLTDGGLETTLIFHHGLDLPHFAAFTLLADSAGRAALTAYYESYLAVADERRVAIVLDTATWRASPDWGFRLGYSREALAIANQRAVELLDDLRARRPPDAAPVVISGAIGPRGDGYTVAERMGTVEAERYHELQVTTFANGAVDVVTALTMTHSEEAAGIALAAAAAGLPSAISFTVETDGRLPSGQPLVEAIEQVDAETCGAPAYFMVNCAHPTHFAHLFDGEHAALDRVRGIRANASTKSHAELDEAEDLDDGDPPSLAAELAALRRRRATLTVLGGCCGTDHRHIDAMARAAA
jgi:S-methylmethionine-dependent homocysteine/selenocysteine methylase